MRNFGRDWGQNIKDMFKRSLLFFSRIPIRIKITMVSVLIVLLPMTLAGVYFYFNISYLLTRNANDSLEQLISQTNINLENSIMTIDSTFFNVLSNPTIRSNTIDGTSIDENLANFLINKGNIESEFRYSMLFNNAWDSQLITTMYLFFNQNSYLSISQSLANNNIVNANNLEIYKNTYDIHRREMLIVPPSAQDRTVYFVRDFYNLNQPDKFVKLVIGSDENEIYKQYAKVLEYPGALGFIMDGSGVIYSHPQKQLLGTVVEKPVLDLVSFDGIKEVILNGQDYFLAFRKIGDSNLIFVTGLPKERVLSNLRESISNSIGIMILILVVCMVFSLVLLLKLTGFINELLVKMNMVKAGNYDAKLSDYNDSDLALLSTTFNNMTSEIKRLIKQVYESQLLQKDNEIKFLQSQMNPHFLFNVLMTIGWKARMQNDATVYKMVTSLSKLLQANIVSGSKNKIPIRQEFELIEFYLYLQKIRFEDRLDFEISCASDDLLDFYLPKLTIEPIVENAVIHGLESIVRKGSVTLNLYRLDNTIIFEIIDNGCGFRIDPDDLLNQPFSYDPLENHNNIGLSNTNRRIKLTYGDQYGIEIQSEVNKGTKVTVRIPVDLGTDQGV
jgi:two-component system, sensor histidine kinase YesM